jgi:hypothetical protein
MTILLRQGFGATKKMKRNAADGLFALPSTFSADNSAPDYLFSFSGFSKFTLST